MLEEDELSESTVAGEVRRCGVKGSSCANPGK